MPLLTSLVLAAAIPVVIDPYKTHGTWEGWGTSLCWMGNVFGDSDEVADLLFTRKMVSFAGAELPGLGMNIARYNLGACSTNEVDGRKMAVSKIILPYRQMEGFWLDGKSADPYSASWDWSRDANQRAMLLKAKARGANHFELFSNSPMWWMCANNNPSGSAKATEDNLRPDMHQAFAVYLATVAAQAKAHWGIEFTTVEPFNEPETDYWFADCKQEGCHFSPQTQADFLPLLRAELDRHELRHTPIAASDETSFDQAKATWNSFDASTRSLIGQVNVHGYQGEHGDRHGLFEALQGKRLWNSEHGEGDASGMELMRGLSLDLFALHPTAWCYWQPLDGGGWGLISTDMPDAKPLHVNTKYYVLAHFTRHILPGMVMLETGDRAIVAAYDRKAQKLVLVAVGGSESSTKTLDLSAFKIQKSVVSHWITEPHGEARYRQEPDALLEGNGLNLTLPANTIQTFEISGLHLSGS